MTAFTGFSQFENRASCDDFTPVGKEAFQHLLQVQQLRLTIDQSDHIHTKGILQLGLLEEIIQNDFRHFIAFQFDNDTHTRFVGLVANIGNAVEFLFTNTFRDAFQKIFLVDLIRQLIDDNRLTALPPILFKMCLGSHDDASTPRPVSLTNPGNTIDNAPGREIRCRNDIDQFVDSAIRLMKQLQCSIDHFHQIVGRNIGCHSDGNTG